MSDKTDFIKMDIETHLYFLRHGQTDNNKEGRMQGRVDIPLNATGRAQAQAAAAMLAGVRFDAVYASPLGRAMETAALAAGVCPQQVKPEPRAIEIDFGVWDNRLHKELEKETKQFDLLWDAPELYVPPAGAEPLADVLARVQAMMHQLAQRHPGGNVLVVTHGGVQQAVFTLVEKRPLHNFWDDFLGNCGCVEVGVGAGGMRVVSVLRPEISSANS